MLFLVYINYLTNVKIKNWHIISYTVDTAVANAENLFPKRQEKHYKSPTRGCRARAVPRARLYLDGVGVHDLHDERAVPVALEHAAAVLARPARARRQHARRARPLAVVLPARRRRFYVNNLQHPDGNDRDRQPSALHVIDTFIFEIAQ